MWSSIAASWTRERSLHANGIWCSPKAGKQPTLFLFDESRMSRETYEKNSYGFIVCPWTMGNKRSSKWVNRSWVTRYKRRQLVVFLRAKWTTRGRDRLNRKSKATCTASYSSVWKLMEWYVIEIPRWLLGCSLSPMIYIRVYVHSGECGTFWFADVSKQRTVFVFEIMLLWTRFRINIWITEKSSIDQVCKLENRVNAMMGIFF